MEHKAKDERAVLRRGKEKDDDSIFKPEINDKY